jgi:hypothetical protein
MQIVRIFITITTLSEDSPCEEYLHQSNNARLKKEPPSIPAGGFSYSQIKTTGTGFPAISP